MQLRIVLCLAAIAACHRADTADSPGGAERLSPPRSDCPLIAATLTSLEMGNYAEREVRAPREAELTKRCNAAVLSDAEAECLRSATTDTLRYCPKPLAVAHVDMPKQVVDGSGLPAACAQYLGMVQRMSTCSKLPPESRKAMSDSMSQAATAWRQLASNPDAVKSLDMTCRQATSAIAQSMQSIGC